MIAPAAPLAPRPLRRSAPGLLGRLFPGRTEAALQARLRRGVPLVSHGAPERLGSLGVAPGLQSLELAARTHRGACDVQCFDVSGEYVSTRLVAARAEGWLARGFSVCLELSHLVQPEIGQALAELCAGLDHPLERAIANTYASPAGDGFSAHFDCHDVLVVQILGAKRWEIAPATVPESPCNYIGGTPVPDALAVRLGHDRPLSMPPSRAVRLRPGSALLLPRGAWHATRALGPSLSVTFSFWERDR